MKLFKHIMLFIGLCLISYFSVSGIVFLFCYMFNFPFSWDLSFKIWIISWIVKILINELKKGDKSE